MTATTDLNICCDVGMDQIYLVCPPLESGTFARALTIDNRTDAIRSTLEEIRRRAGVRDASRLRVVVEPTGIYHQLLTRIARNLGYRTALVNAEHVVKMRSVVFGDSGKTDRRDPHAIAAVADRGRLIIDRVLPEVFQLLRGWSSIYQMAEDGLIEAKGRVHRALKCLFPDFDFSSDFLYSPSGQAIMSCYQFDPHRLAAEPPSRMLSRLRRRSRILRSSVGRLLKQARSSASATPEGALKDLAVEHLRLAWHDYTIHDQRRELARRKLEELYEAARRDDPRLPAAVHRVVTTAGLARLFAELGPLSDFQSWRQIFRLAGLNLRERQSGRYIGQTKITHQGRPQLRRVAMQLVLPLVRRDALFGAYYAQKATVQKMPGPKAMTAVARKFLKMIWGWYHSAAAFDATRVFRAESIHRQVA
ncbi:MAG TPA: transposase [Casimicrobiaceae bacterium]|jgi:transposase|nr:transposase [Casimicrobiaceae bacterium]